MGWDLTLVRLCLSPYRQYHSHLLTVVNGYKCYQFWSILVSLAAFSSTLFFKHQGIDLLRAKKVQLLSLLGALFKVLSDGQPVSRSVFLRLRHIFRKYFFLSPHLIRFTRSVVYYDSYKFTTRCIDVLKQTWIGCVKQAINDLHET